jgi:hypothetical protein
VDLLVPFVGGDRSGETGLLFVGEFPRAGAQGRADPVQRVALAAAVTGGLLLSAAADLVHGPGAQVRYGEGLQDSDGVFGLVIGGVLVVVERARGRYLAASAPKAWFLARGHWA